MGAIGRVSPVKRGAGSGLVPSLRPKDPFAPPPDTCPRCIAPRVKTAGACRKCGVVFARFRADLVAPSNLLAKGWSDLALRWPDAAQHQRFVELALTLGELPAASRLYEIWLAYLPADRLALNGRDELGFLRTLAAATQTERAKLKLSRPVIALLVTLGLLGGSLVSGFA